MPKRIERKRTRGWKMPPGCVYVGRPTQWGNPFEIGSYTRDEAVEMYGVMLDSMRVEHPDRYEAHIPPLRGKDLCCWCRLDQACHADVLLELANA